MRKLLPFLPTHFTICLIFGILLQHYLKFWQITFAQSGGVFTALILLLFVLNNFKKQLLFTFFSWILFVLLGAFAVFTQNDKNYKNHYSNFLKENKSVVFAVDKVLKSDKFYDKYIGKIIKVGNLNTRGKILLNIQKDSVSKPLAIHDKILMQSSFLEVSAPLNPHQFNYKNYLEKQGINHQVFIRNKLYVRILNNTFSIYKLADNFRNTVQKSLRRYNFKEEELAVISALLLGQRQGISKELLEDYTRAGAMHILAVSGLHIGIILLILSAIFKPIERLKNGVFLKTILVVCLLWAFALVAGLSASVVRAVTMFTAVAIGMSFGIKKVITHSLITSLFVLLLCKPMFLFEVGFQLSYLAVFSIVWIQPKLYSLWKPKWYLEKKFWQLSTVSIAAQLGVFPISLFYFHQFPWLFMLSNLVIVTCIGAILSGGIFVISLSLLKILPTFLADIYGFVIFLMNSFVGWISKQEAFLVKDFSLSALMMLSVYLCLLFGVIFFSKKSPYNGVIFLLTIVIFQSVLLYEEYATNSKNEIVIFHKSRKTIIGERKGNNLKIYHDIDSLKIRNLGNLKSYEIGEEMENVVYNSKIPNIIKLNNTDLIIVDNLGVYQIDGLQNCILLLRQSPKINLDRLVRKLNPTKIIADGSNYKSYVKFWENICIKNKIPFYYTGKNGAYIIIN